MRLLPHVPAISVCSLVSATDSRRLGQYLLPHLIYLKGMLIAPILAAAMGSAVPANAQTGDDIGLELQLEIENSIDPAGYWAFGSGGVTFVGEDILLGTGSTLDMPCERDFLFRDFNCSIYGEVTLFNATTGAVVLTVKNPSPDPIDQRICDDFTGTTCRTNPFTGFWRDGFGESLAAFGDDKFVVGAPYDNSFGCGSALNCQTGMVYLYDINGTLLRTFRAPVPSQTDHFGWSVATLGNKVIIGAFSANDFNGAVFVFDGDTGELLMELDNPRAQDTPQRFGYSVAALEDVIIVGDPGWDLSSFVIDYGAFSIFDAETGALISTQSAAIGGQGGIFIAPLDSEQFSVTSSTARGPNNEERAGAVAIHTKSGDFVELLYSPEPTTGQLFGTHDVGRIGEKTIMGGGSRVYVFENGAADLLLNPTDQNGGFGQALATKGNTLAVVAPINLNDPAPKGSLFVYSTERNDELPGSVKLYTDQMQGSADPLRQVSVELVRDGTVVDSTFTDENGEFALNIPEDVTTASIRVTLRDKRPRFLLRDLGASGDPAYLETNAIDLETETRADLVLNDINRVRLNDEFIDHSLLTHNAKDVFTFFDLSTFYYHTMNFYDWANEKLTISFVDSVPIGLETCKEDESSRFSSLPIRITLCRQHVSDIHGFAAGRADKIYTVAHEFSHYVEHQSLIGGLRDPINDPFGTMNHDGYKNPSSSDSFTEGFAMFMGVLMRFELYGIEPTVGPFYTVPLLNLDQTVIVPGMTLPLPNLECDLIYVRTSEELAVATLLWDLYDLSNGAGDPGGDDSISLTIQEIWSIITNPFYNLSNPEIISNLNDLRTVLTNAGLNVRNMFADRLVFLDTNPNCELDPFETVGVTTWTAWDPYTSTFVTHPLVPRQNGVYEPRQNLSLQVFHPLTGEPLTDFDVVVSVVFEPPNDAYDFQGSAHVAASPFVFNALPLEASTMQITVLKEGLEPETIEVAHDEFWYNYLSAPSDVGEAVITRVVNGLTIDIDIKVGSETNAVNPYSEGVIPVAILTTDSFDATTVEPLSVRFGRDSAMESHRRPHIEDVDEDGDADLVLHFAAGESGIVCGDVEVALSGFMFSGTPITGADDIVTVGCR